MTVHELEMIAEGNSLWDFEIIPRARLRFDEDGGVKRPLGLRKQVGSLGVVIVEIHPETHDLIRKELHIMEEQNPEPIVIKLSDAQLKDLAYALI